MKALFAVWWLPLIIPSWLDRAPQMTVRAPALFEERAAGQAIGHDDLFDIYLHIVDGTRSHDILWAIKTEGGTTSFFPAELTPGTEYYFTIAQETPSEQDAVVDPNFRLPHLVKIEKVWKQANEPPVYDRRICEVHHRPMRRELVPVIYGMLASLYSDTELKTLFPHSQEFVAGGCLGGERKTDKVFVCAECKRSLTKWLKINAHRAYSQK